MNKAIFLDRDGTIIENKGYICRLEQSFIFPFAFEAVRSMNELLYKVIVITNQSSIARGICTPEQIESLHSDIRQAFLEHRAVIDGFYYCPYHADSVIEPYNRIHPCRKPSPGMLLQAAADYRLDLSRCFMIGDDVCDIQVGLNAGCKTVLVLTGKGPETQIKLQKDGIIPDFISENLLAAINTIAVLP